MKKLSLLLILVFVVLSSCFVYAAKNDEDDDGNSKTYSNTYSGPGALEREYNIGVQGSSIDETQPQVILGANEVKDLGSVVDQTQVFTWTYSNGVYFECPRNIPTANGLVVTEDYIVKDMTVNTYSGKNTVSFSYTGLRDKSTTFYIIAYDATGAIMNIKNVEVYYDVNYNEKKKKYVYKKQTSEMYYTVPDGAVKVIVKGSVE